jgi:transcriptional antiterminator RfaH
LLIAVDDDGGIMRHEYFSAVGRSWIVVNTQAHRERLAIEHLERQRFITYCPLIRRRVRHARKAQDVLRPLFPGYIFVRIDPKAERWRPILSTVGVRSVVCCGDRPSVLDDGFIASLKTHEVDGAVTRPPVPLQIGQTVRIAGGAFDGLIATILDMDERDRLIVLLDILSRPTKVRIDTQAVMPVGCF